MKINKPSLQLSICVSISFIAGFLIYGLVDKFSYNAGSYKENLYNKGIVVASVSGHDIYKQEIDDYLLSNNTQVSFSDLEEEEKKNVAKQIRIEKILLDKAKNSGLLQDTEVKNLLSKAIRSLEATLLSVKFLEHYAKNTISENEIKDLYAEKSKEFKGLKEVKLKHILLETKEMAQSVIKDIKNGKSSFEELAKDISLDKETGKNGGDLGYIQKGITNKNFENVAFKLKIGEISSQPVKTDFGFHILKLEDKRDVKIPSYEESKSKIRDILIADKIREYLKQESDKLDVILVDQVE